MVFWIMLDIVASSVQCTSLPCKVIISKFCFRRTLCSSRVHAGVSSQSRHFDVGLQPSNARLLLDDVLPHDVSWRPSLHTHTTANHTALIVEALTALCNLILIIIMQESRPWKRVA